MTTPPEVPQYPGLYEAVEEIPSKERAAQMLEINMKYAQCLLDGDFDGMEEYVVDTPVFEEYPLALRITGREAMRERSARLHRTTLPQLDPRKGATDHRILSSAYGKDVIIHEFSNVFTFPDGTRKRCHMVAVVTFDGDKMIGERVYGDHGVELLMGAEFGDDFCALPGVTRLLEEEPD